MLWTVSTVLFVIVMIMLLLFLPVTVELSFGKGIQHYQGKVHIRWLFGIVRSERRFVNIHSTMTDEGPSLHAQVESRASKKQVSERKRHILTAKEVLSKVKDARLWLRTARRSWPVLRRFCRHVHIRQFRTRVVFGTGDAPSTGVMYGVAWSGVGAIAGFISGLCRLDAEPTIEVQPEFQARTFDVYQSCIFRFSPGYAISAGFRLYRVWKHTVGRRRHGTPDFRSHADRNE